MPGLTCNACNKEFEVDTEQKLHYKSDWHRYNLKRKIAGVPGVTETLFEARQSALDQEKNMSNEAPMLYSCVLCGKGYRSFKAHAQHLQSRSHVMRASQGTRQDEDKAVVKPLPRRAMTKSIPQREEEDEESEDSDDEWEEVDPEEELVVEATKLLTELNANEANGDNMDEDGDDDDDDMLDLDPSCCFMCDKEHRNIESCMVHMHRQHGFFIPDVEYLKDPKGLLTYLGLKAGEKGFHVFVLQS